MNISPFRMRVLVLIGQSGWPSPEDLARKAGRADSVVYKAVSDLRSGGLVRADVLELTKKGLDVYESVASVFSSEDRIQRSVKDILRGRS